jgi:triosephosphate isomerase
MNYTPAEAGEVATALAAVVGTPQAEVLVCPTFLALSDVCRALAGSSVAAGAQDVFWKDKGAFTGNISASMLASLGIRYAIVGHSETRGRFGVMEVDASTVPYFGETDATVGLKIQALLAAGIAPIYCVGETLAEREAGSTDAVIQSQMRGSLAGISESALQSLVIAYEPVWAIGTGKVCDTPEAERVCGMIRHEVSCLYSESLAASVRVLYGGSVKPDNAAEIFAQPNIDGGLVGGASLKPDDFSKVIAAAQ